MGLSHARRSAPFSLSVNSGFFHLSGQSGKFLARTNKTKQYKKIPIWMSDFICRLRRTNTRRHASPSMLSQSRHPLFFLYITIHVVSRVMFWAHFLRFWIMKATQQLPPDWCHMFPVLNVVCLFFPLHFTEMFSHQFLGRYVCIRPAFGFSSHKENCNKLGIYIKMLFFVQIKNWFFSKVFVCLFVCLFGPVI